MKLAVSALLLLTGCATTPDFTPTTAPGVKREQLPALKQLSPSPAKTRPGRRPLSVASRDLRRKPLAHLTVTAYCYTGSRNAAGKWPTVGTAAANAYPLGTRLHVATVGDVVVEDRSAPGATDVDIYEGFRPDCQAFATNFGRRVLPVWRLNAA